MSDYKNKKICIVGKGISGKGAYYLALESEAKPYFFDGEFNSPDLIVVSPGVRDQKVFDYAEKNSVPLIGEIEFAYKNDTADTVVAVTGTNGKTTTTQMIGSIFAEDGKSVEVCGNIGVAYSTRCLLSHEVTVLEVSSFQLDTIQSFAPHIAIITNLSPDHIDVHGSFEAYVDAKMKICANQSDSDFLIVDKSVSDRLDSSIKSHIAVIGEDVCVRGDYIVAFERKILRISQTPLKGVFLTDALFAVAAAKLSGIGDKAIKKSLTDFSAQKHRLENVGNFYGKTYYDDSKGTNIGATLAACAEMQGDTVLIAGGSYKGYEYDELIAGLPSSIKYVVAMGAVGKKIKEAAERNDFKNIILCEHLPQAVSECKKLDVKNVLLSPASASFDDYSGYDKRGDHFKRLISER
mgnify:FL=1